MFCPQPAPAAHLGSPRGGSGGITTVVEHALLLLLRAGWEVAKDSAPGAFVCVFRTLMCG